MMPDMILLKGPLQSRNFRLLMACNVVSVAGSAVYFIAIPFAVLRIGGSASDIGYVATAGLIPLIAFLLLGGVIADRLPATRSSWRRTCSRRWRKAPQPFCC